MTTGLPIDIVEQDDLATHRYDFFLVPNLWDGFQQSQQFSWTAVAFDMASRAMVPQTSGVYTLLLQPDIADHPACSYVMYVGQAVSLHRRFRDYVTEEQSPSGRPKIRRFLYKYKGFVVFCFAAVPQDTLDMCEDSLMAAYIPPLNTKFPAEIRAARGAF